MQVALPITVDALKALREAGYVVVPSQPTDEMLQAGAPSCFQAYNGSMESALSDAAECYGAMIAIGCL